LAQGKGRFDVVFCLKGEIEKYTTSSTVVI